MWFLNNNFCHIYVDGKSKTAKKLAAYKNMVEFQNVFSLLYNETVAQIPDIEGIPDTVSQRVIKESIIWHAGFFLFKKGGSTLGLPGLPTGNYTLYGDPAKANVFGRNGFTKEISLYIPEGSDAAVRETVSGTTAPEDGVGVWVRANYLVYPVINYIIEYADKIADSLRTLDIVRKHLKKPYIFTADETALNSIKAYINSRDNNEEEFVCTGAFPADRVNVISLDANETSLTTVTMNIEWYLSQFHQIIGVSSPSTVDKKAEITTAELNSHKGVEDLHNRMLEDIYQKDLDFANEKLGLSMSLKPIETEDPELTEEEDDDDATGNSNEEIQ